MQPLEIRDNGRAHLHPLVLGQMSHVLLLLLPPLVVSVMAWDRCQLVQVSGSVFFMMHPVSMKHRGIFYSRGDLVIVEVKLYDGLCQLKELPVVQLSALLARKMVINAILGVGWRVRWSADCKCAQPGIKCKTHRQTNI